MTKNHRTPDEPKFSKRINELCLLISYHGLLEKVKDSNDIEIVGIYSKDKLPVVVKNLLETEDGGYEAEDTNFGYVMLNKIGDIWYSYGTKVVIK